MQIYKSSKSSHGVEFYEIFPTSIKVQFVNSTKIYSYSYSKAGKDNVEEMKILAKNGSGLSTFISQNVRNLND